MANLAHIRAAYGAVAIGLLSLGCQIDRDAPRVDEHAIAMGTQPGETPTPQGQGDAREDADDGAGDPPVCAARNDSCTDDADCCSNKCFAQGGAYGIPGSCW